MNTHKNARLSFEGRKLLIERIEAIGLVPAASAAGTSPRTARTWYARKREGLAGLMDRSSRPHKARSAVDVKHASVLSSFAGIVCPAPYR